MDKIRLDFFDILGYLVPGTALLLVLWTGADPQVRSIWQVYNSIHQLDQKSLVIGLVLAYMAGFVLHALGSLLYNLYRYRSLGKAGKSKVPAEWAIVREYGTRHLAILERWYALRALAQNLAAVCVAAMLVCLVKWLAYGYWEWLVALMAACALCLVLLQRAVIFRTYLRDDMEATLNLHLEEDQDSLPRRNP